MGVSFDDSVPTVSPFICPKCGSHRTRVIQRAPTQVRIQCVKCGHIAWMSDDGDPRKAESQSASGVRLADRL